ncbi:unnamed protein product [Rhizophagus irregularis]|nr:unnamed protein product [Rhizophagus irregularis]
MRAIKQKKDGSNLITGSQDNWRVLWSAIYGISCWIHVAKTIKAVFNKKFTSDSYEELQQCLEEEFSILPKVFVNFVNLPNIHVNMHLLMHAKTFGILINTQVADDGIDPRFNRSCIGFINSNFGQLFLNWYIIEDKYSTEAIEQV